jgi:hypothetical protein
MKGSARAFRGIRYGLGVLTRPHPIRVVLVLPEASKSSKLRRFQDALDDRTDWKLSNRCHGATAHGVSPGSRSRRSWADSVANSSVTDLDATSESLLGNGRVRAARRGYDVA